jgi:hypothetical protein
VLGDGQYAAALAFVIGGASIGLDELHAGPQPNQGGGFPQVFEKLVRAFLVVPEVMSGGEALQCHQAVWRWVEKLSPAGDQHDLAFVFILAPSASREFEQALAAPLGLPGIDPTTTGHAVWRQPGTLTSLIDLLAAIQPRDLVFLRARQTADLKRAALVRLREGAAQGDSTATRNAAREVLATFSGREYLLDVFCRPPSHQHGNLVRAWLRRAAMEPVTQDGWWKERNQLGVWLAQNLGGAGS